MHMRKASRKADIGREADPVIRKITSLLVSKRQVRVVHIGLLKVEKKKGGMRYDFKKQKMVPYPGYKTIVFKPAKDLRDKINKK